jgi:hypothetical protein
MKTISSDEIRGDWSNLKGTEYHFLYALWLIIRNQAATVAFYEGNDLVARSRTPAEKPPAKPTSKLDDDDSPALSLHGEQSGADIWIQLKSTKSGWSCTRLLEENLLINFICNAIQSEAANKAWVAKLVTQGFTQREDVKDFVAFPERHPKLSARLAEIIELAQARLLKEGWVADEVTIQNLRRIAFEVLSQLAESEPMLLQTFKSAIEVELNRAYPDQAMVMQLGNSLLGALLSDSAAGPENARVYDSEWLNAAAGKPIVNRGMFDEHPVAACNAAVRRAALEIGYRDNAFTPRVHLSNALKQFMCSDETLFVLTGVSGAGKSWSCSDWASNVLGDQLRLLLPSSDMDHDRSLHSLIANRLRPFSSAFWPDNQFLKRLITACQIEGCQPFAIIVDDLNPIGDLEIYRRDLARLVEECRAHHFKLIFICQTQVWAIHHLGAEIPSSDLFVLSAEHSPSEFYSPPVTADKSSGRSPAITVSAKLRVSDCSFQLYDFSPEEQCAVLRQHFSPEQAAKVADHFRSPTYMFLRSPYYLARYLERHQSEMEVTSDPPPFDLDELLDWRINLLIQKTADMLTVSANDIRPAFNALVDSLWISRGQGLRIADAIISLASQFPERGADLLLALRKSGFLTAEAPVQVSDSLLSERLFALRLGQCSQPLTDADLSELHPETHAGVISAYLRAVASDPVAVSGELLRRNSKWASAIASGLAQGVPSDWRSLSLLTTFLNSEDGGAVEAGYAGLGQIAPRSQRAWKWVAELFLGDHARTWSRGSHALSSTVDYIPKKVEAAIRARLTRRIHINEPFFSERDKLRAWILNGSLDPLRGINHSSSARVGNHVVRRYKGLAETPKEWFFINDLDHIRGRIALFGGDGYLNDLIAEFDSESAETRYRAAYALRPVVAERPETVNKTLLRRIASEKDFQVLKRALLISFHLIHRSSGELLDALKQSPAGNLNEPKVTTGLVLSLLGNMPNRESERVEQMLVNRLDKHPTWARALSVEMLAYAWWRCAENSKTARRVLADIARPDLLDVEGECIPFALRGSAIASLGLMCLELGLSSEKLVGRQTFYPKQERTFLYLETVDFYQENVRTLVRHSALVGFLDLLVQAVNEEEEKQVHPIYPIREAQFRCASMCLELIAQTAAVQDDPLVLLKRLPRNWQAIRAATRLLQLGRHEPEVVSFARESFAGLEHEGTVQALEERRLCQAQLSILDNDDERTQAEQREAVVPSIFIQTSGNSLGLAFAASKNPDNLLHLFEENLQHEHDLPTLYYLVEEARSWPSLLMARVFSRMLNSCPISVREAKDLCEQIHAVTNSLSRSSLREEYEFIYLSIHDRLSNPSKMPTLSDIDSFSNPDNPLRRSHHVSIEILNTLKQQLVRGEGDTNLDKFLFDRRGFIETAFYALRQHLLVQGTTYSMWFFPAVRLSLVAAGGLSGLKDPCGRLMAERFETARIIRDHTRLYHQQRIDPSDYQYAERAVLELQKRAGIVSGDERLPDALGGLLLRMSRLDEAEEQLERSLSLPLSDGEMRSHTLNNLACVYAQMGDESKSRKALEQSAKLCALDKNWLRTDSDLDPVRDSVWFRELVEH